MSIKNFAAVVCLALGSGFAVIGSARADVVRRDANNNVYVYTGTPAAQREISYVGSQRTRKVTANRCGVAKISPSLTYANATQISVGGTTSDLSSLPTETPGKCVSSGGTYTSEDAPAAQRYKDAVGAVYIQGLSPNSEQVVTYPDLPISRSVKADTCGLIKLTNSDRNPISNTTQIQVSSNTYSVSSMSAVIAPSCKKVTPTSSAFMVPLNQAGMWGS